MRIREVNDATVITTNASAQFPDGRYRHAIGWISAGDTGRREDGGPEVPGPWAYAYGISTVITSNPRFGSGADARRGRAAGREFPVVEDDILQIDGNFYKVHTFRNEQFVTLRLMDVAFTWNSADQASHGNVPES